MEHEHASGSCTPVPIEIWAGVECTFNRVRDDYHDQLHLSGHRDRIEDLDRFAELGIRVMRYPVLWEQVAPDAPDLMDFSWTDERLARLRSLGITPVAGLVHHGSGPRYTDLLSESFVHGLAAHARAVAERYPWLEMYTPVNEPLTTARFSALYGHWFPHRKDDRSFVRALLNQCLATARCMQAVRQVNPAARLVQTEDLAKVFSTPKLAHQARFENERRWLTFDLLCGRVDRRHIMWNYLVESGASPDCLGWLQDHPCPPDILGLNHYVTSERFLDERVDRYPACTHGGNGRERYADVEAVRVLDPGPAGAKALFMETWERYRRPIAVTEVHLHSTREEQMRWFLEVWQAARRACDEGAEVRAITAWALLGSFDWDRLVTACRGSYEPGVYDLRSPRPRPTALTRMVRNLAHGKCPEHPVLRTPGWWRRPERLIYPSFSMPHACASDSTPMTGAGLAVPQPVLIVGATGTLGRAFARLCAQRGLAHVLIGRAEMDIADLQTVRATLQGLRPWAVINAAGYVRVDDAEHQRDRCFRENVLGAMNLARACAAADVQLVCFSSDLVFDGRKKLPYVESDAPAPLGVYGQSKHEAEATVLKAFPDALVVRTSAFFGPWDAYNFVTVTLDALHRSRPFRAADDVVVSPTYIPDLVHTTLDLLIDGASGRWHLANRGAVSWAELARRAARLAGADDSLVCACTTGSLGLHAPRPLYSVLGSEKGHLMPSLDDALPRYFNESDRSTKKVLNLFQDLQ